VNDVQIWANCQECCTEYKGPSENSSLTIGILLSENNSVVAIVSYLITHADIVAMIGRATDRGD